VTSKDQRNQRKREDFLLEKVDLQSEMVYPRKQLVQREKGSIGLVWVQGKHVPKKEKLPCTCSGRLTWGVSNRQGSSVK